jgi:tetratricopeptide (TPR) repeat protein
MKYGAGIFIFLFFFIIVNIEAQNWELLKRDQLLAEDYYGVRRREHNEDKYINLLNNSKGYFFKAKEYHNKKDYKNALANYEIALSMYSWGAYYYQYGLCFLDMEDYVNAEKAFLIAIRNIRYDRPYDNYYLYKEPLLIKNPIYTFDNNGIVKELYFSFYNIACIYSIKKRIEDSFKYVILALEYGYPYLNHIFSDVDLVNLFNSPNSAKYKNEINRVYSAGAVNNVGGKTFMARPGPNDAVGYEFIDNNRVKRHDYTSDDKDRVLYGTYKVSNYHVIIKYNRVTGGEGVNAIGAGTITIYDKYIPYDKNINETEYISLKEQEMLEDWGWKEE